MSIISKLSKFIPRQIKEYIGQEYVSTDFYKFLNTSFSQEGEDLILDKYLNYKKKGFFVDIGAHHPMRFSNTYLFYLRGWRGINIDAMPNSMTLFRKYRPNDINIEVSIAENEGISTYYVFTETALNTFSEAIAKKIIDKNYSSLVNKYELKTRKLSSVLDEYLPSGQLIDFMTIDAEGFDLQILHSNNWLMYRPNYILVEAFNDFIFEIENTELNKYLRKTGYMLSAKTENTLLYQNIDVVS